MNIWNQIFNPKQVICIHSGRIFYNDGTSAKACPFARYKDFLKEQYPNLKFKKIEIMQDGIVISTVKSISRINKYYLSIGDKIVFTSEEKTYTQTIPSF